MTKINCITTQEISGQLDCYYKKYRFINCKLNNFQDKPAAKIILLYSLSTLKNFKNKIEMAEASNNVFKPGYSDYLTILNFNKHFSYDFLIFLLKYGFNIR